MLWKSEAPPVGGASRNSCGGCFRDLITPALPNRQPLPKLIETHIGAEWLSGWAAGRASR